jgi:hypothetical protein
MRVLCFTTTYQRPKFLRSCILDIQNQTYSADHAINIAYDDLYDYTPIIDDLVNNNIFLRYSRNADNHTNHINALKLVNHDNYDLFVKIDDDEFYKKKYIETIVNNFTEGVDIVSSSLKYQINNYYISKGDYHNLGANPEGYDFKMPTTFAFNRKALNLILKINDNYGFEDNMWRDVWANNSINHKVIDNSDNVIWYIHGKNISTKHFYKE